MSELLERLGVERPVVQAGMGGGLSRARLAAAVSEAGGLGTIGILPPDGLRAEIAAARERTDRPVAVNLLLPFARRAHAEAARDADVVVTFWGRPRRPADRPWLHQAGSLREAVGARGEGADGVILQGVEAGGHVRGELPALELLAIVRREIPPPYPLLLAGGISDRTGVEAALDVGADAAVLGTRFLMTPESDAHPLYRERLVAARETLLTELFGMGWPAKHRVVENEATRRWLAREPRGPVAVRALNRITAPLASRTPVRVQEALLARQSARVPLFAPVAPTTGRPATLLETAPLYAGETVARIDDIRPAGDIVRELAP
ncbi:MAG: nitronate monooxygenase [Actinomycetota bacterium]|nr:nitronate monooxygenase [Actinomycetota bacterium]